MGTSDSVAPTLRACSAASKVLLGLYAPVCANQPSLSSIVRDLQNDQRWDRPDVEADRHSAIESTESKSEPKGKDAAAPERAQPGFSSVRQNTTVVPRTAGTDQALRVHSYGTQHTTQHRTRNCCTVYGGGYCSSHSRTLVAQRGPAESNPSPIQAQTAQRTVGSAHLSAPSRSAGALATW